MQEITDNSFVFVNDKGTPGSAGQHGEKGEKGDPGRVRIKGKHTFCHSAFCFPIMFFPYLIFNLLERLKEEDRCNLFQQ